MVLIPRVLICALSFCLAAETFLAGCAQMQPQEMIRIPDGPVAREFVYPVGYGNAVTQARDSKDDWYNAQDFGENDHLGEDWNGNSGGNSDCGKPVRAAGNGIVSFAGDAGPGWGNVIIVDHLLADGTSVQSLYGHLKEVNVRSGEVSIGQMIGSVGDGNGRYLCHLHFEIRTPSASAWGVPGPGYSRDRNGWLDPSDFIDSRLKVSLR